MTTTTYDYKDKGKDYGDKDYGHDKDKDKDHDHRPKYFTVSGMKFGDTDNDGKKDGNEKGLPNWTIQAYVDRNRDGKLDKDEINKGWAASDTTDDKGDYSLKLKDDKQYIVVEKLQTGYEETKPTKSVLAADAANLGFGPYGYVVNTKYDPYHKDFDHKDFGNHLKGATVSGTKFNDKDRDGHQDGNEKGLPNWTIKAYKDTDGDHILDKSEYKAGAAATAKTDANGDYKLNLSPPAGGADYILVEVLKDDWKQGPTPPTKVLDKQIDDLGKYGYAFNLKPGDNLTDKDFGNEKKKDDHGHDDDHGHGGYGSKDKYSLTASATNTLSTTPTIASA